MNRTLTLTKNNSKFADFLLIFILLLLAITNSKAQTPCTLPAFPAPSEILTNAPEASVD